ncbi:ABC transporter permease [Mucilaginibacter segetis]|uniref:ABC transporter permease n=1 Tax=Mucilaginibacter segetis TaxID=2793071 RepID=A0A934PR08_9SPHI|nr:ABC transporter permease [Mucilaginibacter segetis]MBK0379173.1 ABC transporter permease [Mucilaginibacter segetis]
MHNKFYAIINITGLTLGLVIGIFMLLWVQDEFSFDSFNKNAEKIYKVDIVAGTGISRQIFNNIIAPVATFAKNEIPEVKNAVRITSIGDAPFQYKDKVFFESNFAFTDPSYFSVFDFKLIRGNPKNPFPDINSLVITESTAKKYFGDENPIGKTVIMGQNEPCQVSGVIADYPPNSSFQYHVLLPMARLNYLSYIKNSRSYDGKTIVPSMDADWSNFGFETFLLLKHDVNLKALEKKLQAIHERNKPEDAPVPYLVQPLIKMHLFRADGTDGGYSTVRTLTIVAVMILIIACINYVNLSTARSLLRAKEVSMRKIIGAGKSQLFIQFIIETGVLFIAAAALSLILMFLLLPYFNNFSGKQIAFNLSDTDVWFCILVSFVGTLLASSIYPAMLLSSFEPLKALKGRISGSIGNVNFRRVLVVVQFATSIILIIGTLVISKQLSYIRNKDLGYDKEHVFAFTLRNDMQEHYDAVKNDLLKYPAIVGITHAGRDIVNNGGGATGDNDWDGKPANSNLWFNLIPADEQFIPFFKMDVIQGKNFTGAVADSSHFLINETAAKEMGITDPVGKRLRIQTVNGTIIGVVKDFNFATVHKKIEPIVFRYQLEHCWRVYIKASGKNIQKAIAAAQTQWKLYNNDIPFNYTFLDDSYTKLYSADQKQGDLFKLFSVVAIMISCLGLLGLTTYSAQVKTREIGIRKVLGASIGQIVNMLAKEFILLILLAIIIAIPIAWYSMNSWLRDFAYKINLTWVSFALSGFGVIVIALVTISFQSVKAAMANPVKSLRSE